MIVIWACAFVMVCLVIKVGSILYNNLLNVKLTCLIQVELLLKVKARLEAEVNQVSRKHTVLNTMHNTAQPV